MSKMMALRFTEVVPTETAEASGVVTLGFADRRRSRMRIHLDDGREAALMLPRGTILHDGDRLRDPESGVVVSVRAADQTLSFVHAAGAVALARAAYHLGNRHIPVQVGAGWLAYEHDHVLDQMVEELGLAVEAHFAPFEPEAGGYRHGAASGHSHGRAHGHEHEHDHHERHEHHHEH
jgi:urease accessory protein